MNTAEETAATKQAIMQRVATGEKHICLMDAVGSPLMADFVEDKAELVAATENYCTLHVEIMDKVWDVNVEYTNVFSEDGYDLFVVQSKLPRDLTGLMHRRLHKAYHGY